MITALMVALLALSGCSPAYPAAFHRAQTVGDIPDLDYGEWDIKQASARFLAEESGIQYFVARNNEESLCLVLVRIGQPNGAVMGCSEHGVAVEAYFGPKVELIVPDMDERPGWRKLAPNLYAQD